MIELKLTTTYGETVHLFLNSNFAIRSMEYMRNGESHVGSLIVDGVHNNGGWVVREQVAAVLSQIRQQQEAVA